MKNKEVISNHLISELMDTLVEENGQKLKLHRYKYCLFLKDGFLIVHLDEETDEVIAEMKIKNNIKVIYENDPTKEGEDVIHFHDGEDLTKLHILNMTNIKTFHTSQTMISVIESLVKKQGKESLKPVSFEKKSWKWYKVTPIELLFKNVGIFDIFLVSLFFALLLFIIKLKS